MLEINIAIPSLSWIAILQLPFLVSNYALESSGARNMTVGHPMLFLQRAMMIM